MRQKGNKGSMLNKNQGNNKKELQRPELEQFEQQIK